MSQLRAGTSDRDFGFVEESDDQQLYQAELERQIDDLKVKLYYKENELDHRGSQQRLISLLEEIRGKIEQVEEEKLILQQQIQYYHQRLLLVDVENEKIRDDQLTSGDINATTLFPGGLASKDLNLYDIRGSVRKSLYVDDYTDREKLMQAALKQSLLEKDNAMKVLIKLLGKEALQEIMKFYEPSRKQQLRNSTPISPWTSSGSLRTPSPSRRSNSFLPPDVAVSERERYYDYLLDALTNPSKHVPSKNGSGTKEKTLTPHARSFKSANNSITSSPMSPVSSILGLPSRSPERKYLHSPTTVDKYGNVKKSPPPKLTESDIMAALRLSP